MGDVHAITQLGIGTFARLLDTGGPDSLPDEHLAALAASAAQRAEEGIPMPDVVRAYFVGVQTMFDYLEETLGPELHPGVTELARHGFGFLQAIIAAVADGYSRERELTLGEALSARLQLGSALVEGRDDGTVAEAAAFAGVELPPSYAVVALRISEPTASPARSAPSDPPTPNSGVVHARLLRRVRAHLVGGLDKDVLWLPNYRDALVLVPVGTGGHGADFTVTDFEQLRAGLEIPVVAGLSSGTTTGSGVSEAARVAMEVRDFVDRLGRPSGCYELADVALEYQMSRPGAAQRALAQLVVGLQDEPALRTTLDVYINENRHRLRTARRLEVHANTVDNRLRKIASLTGLDPNRPRDMTRLEAAMAAAALGHNS